MTFAFMETKAREGSFAACLIVAALLLSIQGQSALSLVLVAKDGTGNFTSITSAINAAPNNSRVKYYIQIKAGIYEENVTIDATKMNIVLIGDGVDRTIITGRKSNTSGYGTDRSATVGILADGFTAKYITFENTAGPQMGQAVAVMTVGNHIAFYRCRFKGYQDTLFTKSGNQFFRECNIQGTVDFIFGDAAVVFQNCIIQARRPLSGQQNVITAQGREFASSRGGTVFHNCTITATPDLFQNVSIFKTFLGRPWKTFSRTIIIQSQLDFIIDARGWLGWPGHPVDHVYYAEYENRGPGADRGQRVEWSKNLSNPIEASSFTVRRFIAGDRWIPVDIPHYLDLIGM